MSKITNREYAVPFVLVTTLFFMWGFARSILDVLNKHFQNTLDLSITESTWIQVTTYLAYFTMAIPAGLFINRYGYRRGVVVGLTLFALGAFAFVPANVIGRLGVFLVALFVIGSGLVFLETSANPYSTELGPHDTASSRLNLSQAFNGLGSSIAPALVGGFLFAGGSVDVPYIVMGCVVVVAAIVFSRVKLPEIKHDDDNADEAQSGLNNMVSLLKHHKFMLGLLALLSYEVAEISINSYFIQFTHGMNWLEPQVASTVLTVALMCFMVGRFVCSFIMQRVAAERVLLVCAVGTVACTSSVLLCGDSRFGLYALIANYAFESIMFPTIFAQSLKGLGGLTKTASSMLMMTPVGGCAFMLVGIVADSAGFLAPFYIPLAAFVIVLLYTLSINRKQCDTTSAA